jgi:hypothetical protein
MQFPFTLTEIFIIEIVLAAKLGGCDTAFNLLLNE